MSQWLWQCLKELSLPQTSENRTTVNTNAMHDDDSGELLHGSGLHHVTWRWRDKDFRHVTWVCWSPLGWRIGSYLTRVKVAFKLPYTLLPFHQEKLYMYHGAPPKHTELISSKCNAYLVLVWLEVHVFIWIISLLSCLLFLCMTWTDAPFKFNRGERDLNRLHSWKCILCNSS